MPIPSCIDGYGHNLSNSTSFLTLFYHFVELSHSHSKLHLVDGWLENEYRGRGQDLLTKLQEEYRSRPAATATSSTSFRSQRASGPRTSQPYAAPEPSAERPSEQPVYAMNYPTQHSQASSQPPSQRAYTTPVYAQPSMPANTGGRYGERRYDDVVPCQ